MKTSYKFACGLLIAFLAIGFSAFRKAESVDKAPVADAWFQLKSGISPTQTNALNINNYEAPSETPACAGTSAYCGVRANNNAGKPDLSSGTTARTQVTAYFSSGTAGGQIQLRD